LLSVTLDTVVHCFAEFAASLVEVIIQTVSRLLFLHYNQMHYK